YLTEEVLEVRLSLLQEALQEAKMPDALMLRWIKIDRAFWSKIKNDSKEGFDNIDLKYQKPLVINRPEDT
ncbi:MAG: group 1 truncated hemoglobin, partial [Mariprofundaceae bacterium]